MTLSLTQAQQVRQNEFRAFAQEHVEPRAAQHDARGEFDLGLVGELGQAGYLGPVISPPAGAISGVRTLDPIEWGLLHEEVGRACSATRSLLTVQDMVAGSIRRWGSDAQAGRRLPALTAGGAIAALAITEDGAGSDIDAVAARLEPDGPGYRLTGTKCWITFGQVASLFLVIARERRGLTAVLVDRDRSGIIVRPTSPGLGLRGAMLAEVSFESCPIGVDDVLGPRGRAHPFVTTFALTLGRLSVASGATGILHACADLSSAYAARRMTGEHQLVQRLLARMIVDAEASRMLCGRAAELVNEGSAAGPVAAAQAKYFASTAAARAARDAVQILGAAGCSPDHPIARLFRDAKVLEIIEGSTEISEIMIGRAGPRAGSVQNARAARAVPVAGE